MKSGADNGDGFGGWSLIDAEMRLQYRLLGDDQLWSWIDLGGGRRGPEMPWAQGRKLYVP